MPVKQPLDWDQIRLLLAVSRAGSMAVGAQHLRIDYSTLSRRIAALEASLGARLIERRKTGSTLTEFGQRLLPMAEQMEHLAKSAQQSIGAATSQAAGTVRIGAPDGFGTRFLAPRVGLLSERYPDLTIEVAAMPREYNLLKREADLVVTVLAPTDSLLRSRKLTDYELGLYASREYLAKHPAPQTIPEAASHRFISYIDDLVFSPGLEYSHLISPQLRPAVKSSNLIAQLNAAVAGVGLSVLPYFIAKHEPTLVRLLPAQFKLIRSFWLAAPRDTRNLSRVRAVERFIADEATREHSEFIAQ